jgi:hypothetical protein
LRCRKGKQQKKIRKKINGSSILSLRHFLSSPQHYRTPILNSLTAQAATPLRERSQNDHEKRLIKSGD